MVSARQLGTIGLDFTREESVYVTDLCWRLACPQN
jgi:hypothetical protein